MRTLRVWLRRLFLRNRRSPAHLWKRETGPIPMTFEAWINGYRQRLRQNCERNERS